MSEEKIEKMFASPKNTFWTQLLRKWIISPDCLSTPLPTSPCKKSFEIVCPDDVLGDVELHQPAEKYSWCFAFSLKFLAWKKLNDSHAWLGRNNEYQLRWNLCFKSDKKQNILSYAPSTDQQLIWFSVFFSKVGKWNPERFLISSRIPQDQNQNGRWNYKLNIWLVALALAILILTC